MQLIARGRGRRQHVDPFAILVEHHLAVHEGEQSPVAPRADIVAGDELRAALADENAARRDKFASKPFYTESFADAITSVADAAAAFFMCHISSFDFFNS